MYKRRILWVVLLGLMVLAPATPVLADGGPPWDDGVVLFGEDYTLEAGEELDGNVVLFGGSATLEAGSRVEGDVVVFGGDANVTGTVEGDVVVFGGDIHLADTAVVEGSVVSGGGDVEREEGAEVKGDIVEGIPFWSFRFDREWHMPPMPVPIPVIPSPAEQGARLVLRFFLGLARAVLGSLMMAAIGALVVLVWPEQTARVGQAVVGAPLPSFGVGLLSIVAAAAALAVLTVTCLLAPLAGLGALVVGAAILFGWVALGTLLGERLLKALNARQVTPLGAAALGVLLVTLLTAALGLLPCLGWIVGFAFACLGLGAVVLTRFGTMVYATPGAVLPPVLPVSPEPPELAAAEGEEGPM